MLHQNSRRTLMNPSISIPNQGCRLVSPGKTMFGNAPKPQDGTNQSAGSLQKIGEFPGFGFEKKTPEPNLHPGRLTWNLQITHLERKMIWTKPPSLCSMLFFRGVRPCKQVCYAGWCWIWVLRALWRRWGSTLRAQVFRCRSPRCRGPRRGTPHCAL